MDRTRTYTSGVGFLGLVLLALCTPALVGCSSHAAPRFEVLGVSERERTPEAVVLDFTIGATNRNEDPLPLDRATYALSLDGQRVFSGQRLARVTVPQFGEQRLVLPVVVPAQMVSPERFDAGGDIRYVLSGEIEYQTPGRLAEFLFDINLRRPSTGLDLRGVLELPGAGGS
jgi:hypothetical protein